jgi:acyl carrier protein
MPMTETEVFEKVREALVEALSVDEEEVVPTATLMGDLGAESIDFLDIVFRLEKSFNIKIPRGELFPDGIQNNPDFVQDGKLTAAGLTKLMESMPHADLSEVAVGSDIGEMAGRFKVQDLLNYVKRKVMA